MARRRGKPRRAQKKKIIVIAGPNGAGKTTFAEEFLTREANCPNFTSGARSDRDREEPIKRKRIIIDKETRGAWQALKRAAKRARALSEATGTPLFVVQDGKLIDLNRTPRPRRKAG